MMDETTSNQKKVEAILFTVGKGITTERIAALCSIDEAEVNNHLVNLKEVYDQRDHSLRITQHENTWKLTVRDEFIPLVSSIVQSTDMERAVMQTLAVIAWRYPVVQSEIIKLRGPSAYEHMAGLIEQGFVSKEKFGRTYKVKLTKKFFEFFDLPSDEAKQAFLKQVPIEILQEAEDVNKEADEIDRVVEAQEKKVAAHSEISRAMHDVKKE